MEWVPEIVAASERIRPHVRTTPIDRSRFLERDGAARVWLKLENYQHTGSFKVRGATNTILSLPEDERTRGVVAASSGNHGAGVARAAARAGCPALVFVPNYAADHKVAAIEAHGAEVRRLGDDCVVTEQHARKWATEQGRTYLSPYNDPRVIAGQGTIAVEMAEQIDRCDAVFVAVGGGGLISGIGAYLEAQWPGAEIVACSPANSPAMHAALEAERIVEIECHETLSDATAGGMESDAITFETCRRVVDRSILVDEAEIASALREIVAHHHMLIEGAAAVAVAGYRQCAADYAGRSVAIVLCGANIGVETLRSVLTGTPS